MKRGYKLFSLFISIFFLLSILITHHLTAEKIDDIQFLWAFGTIKESPDGMKLVPITQDMVLYTGDKIKMFIKPEKRCYIYLIYHSSQGDIQVLFPYRFEEMASKQFYQSMYYIPQGEEWFELDENTGFETFHLLVSTRRLINLESLINRYETVGSKKKHLLATQILDEIKQIRWKNRKFKTFAEKPVTIMGQVRGASRKPLIKWVPDISTIAVRITAKDFYSRTFTIDHR